MIDITMTAIIARPEILMETLVSIKNNVRYDGDLRLIIDVAPCDYGELNCSQYDILQIASSLFEDSLFIHRANEESLQAEAIKWMWGEATSDYILHWEDDWIATKSIDLNLILPYFRMESLGMIYFDREGKSVKDYPGYKGAFEHKFFDLWFRYRGKSFGGPPAIMTKEYIKGVIPFIKNNECLDITSRCKESQAFLKNWNIAVYTGENNEGNLVRDIGKDWRKKHGLKMVKNTPKGVSWIRE